MCGCFAEVRLIRLGVSSSTSPRSCQFQASPINPLGRKHLLSDRSSTARCAWAPYCEIVWRRSHCNNASKLLLLPAELCNQIWELVLIKEEPLFCPCAFPALLHTCRQIRKETSGMFIEMNAFFLQPHPAKWWGQAGNHSKTMTWLRAVERMKVLQYMYRVRVEMVSGFCPETRGHTYYVRKKGVKSCTQVYVNLRPPNHAHVWNEVCLQNLRKYTGAQQRVITGACIDICTLLCLKHQEIGNPVQGALTLWKKVLNAIDRIHRVDKTKAAIGALQRQNTKARIKTEALQRPAQ